MSLGGHIVANCNIDRSKEMISFKTTVVLVEHERERRENEMNDVCGSCDTHPALNQKVQVESLIQELVE